MPTITELIDKRRGNTTPSINIAEALGAKGGARSISDALEGLMATAPATNEDSSDDTSPSSEE